MHVLIIDREEKTRLFLSKYLQKHQCHITSVESGVSALEHLKKMSFDLVLSEMQIDEVKGVDFYKYLKIKAPNTPLVLMLPEGSDPLTQKDLQNLADDSISKPLQKSAMQVLISLINSKKKPLAPLIAKSPAMKEILTIIKKIASSNANVFISGESGTGKEIIATYLHHFSTRANKPFIKVNCAALPETLIESEFFGHEKGAFTGALSTRKGRFELADQGTLLLDEISEIPPSLQAKLLRATQEQEFERLGGMSSIQVDVRFISTSNRNINDAIQKKEFREDLFYRLNVVPIEIPPLRKRPEDILPLANYFLTKHSPKKEKKFSPKAKEKLTKYSWPGNVRQLSNVIEYAIALDLSEEIQAEHLHLTKILDNKNFIDKDLTLGEVEKRHIQKILIHHENNRQKTANALGISVRTLRNKLSLYNH